MADIPSLLVQIGWLGGRSGCSEPLGGDAGNQARDGDYYRDQDAEEKRPPDHAPDADGTTA
jgi:hypothetical protein